MAGAASIQATRTDPCSGRTTNLWAIVLAGGEGTRLRPLIRRLYGEERPKQYASLLGLPVSASVPVGEPKSLLVEEGRRWNADLIVVGSHGRRGLDRLFLGSVSEAVALHASCSVEVVRCERRP